MKTKLIHASLWLCSLGSLVGNSAGHELGNPLDFIHENDSTAWFPDERRTIRTCYIVAPNFGVGNDALVYSIQEAFMKWKAYLLQKKIRRPLNHHSAIGLQFATDLTMLPSCDGTEDLKVYFGVTNDQVERHQAHADNELGFAARTSYNDREGWGKGIIWITGPNTIDTSEMSPSYPFPDWSRNHILNALMLHEVGHIFGCSHVDHTIMREDLAVFLYAESRRSTPTAHLTSIDAGLELVLCSACGFEYDGTLGNPWQHENDESTRRVFEKLMGRQPKGVPHAYLRKEPGDSSELMLLVGDSQDARWLSIHLTSDNIFRSDSSSRLFRRYKVGPYARERDQVPHEAWIRYGTLTTHDGSSLAITFERNGSTWGPRRAAINYFDGGGVKPLFVTNFVR